MALPTLSPFAFFSSTFCLAAASVLSAKQIRNNCRNFMVTPCLRKKHTPSRHTSAYHQKAQTFAFQNLTCTTRAALTFLLLDVEKFLRINAMNTREKSVFNLST